MVKKYLLSSMLCYVGGTWRVIFFNVFKASLHKRGTQLFDMGNEGKDGIGSKTLNCCCSPKGKVGDMICTCSWQCYESTAHVQILNFLNSLKVITYSPFLSY
jgi:hypothetical protein